MRHRHSRFRLKQKPAHAALLQRNLATSVILYEAVRTTKKRAEVVSPIVEKLITIAKTKDTMNAIRQINQVVTHKNACRKMMEILKPRFADRSSGYTRMVPVGARKGDGAELVDLMLLEGIEVKVSSDEKNQKKQKMKKNQKSASSKKSSESSVSSESSDSSK